MKAGEISDAGARRSTWENRDFDSSKKGEGMSRMNEEVFSSERDREI